MPRHRSKTVGYSAKYDAQFSLLTGRWLEGKCKDPKCQFCPNRPKTAPLPRKK
jgi:hypothetical protein